METSSRDLEWESDVTAAPAMPSACDLPEPLVEFLHFGADGGDGGDGSLFGAYHPPVGPRVRTCGVVICPPPGQEHIRSHRSLRLLARRLAQEGFHCLRFDPFGVGDSAGDDEDCDLLRMGTDIGLAIAALREGAGVENVALVGLRLGATALCSGSWPEVGAAVLWSPVSAGLAYWEELRREHTELLGVEVGNVAPAGAVAAPDEALGFALGASLRQEMERLDGLPLGASPAPRVLLVDRQPTPALARAAESWRGLGAEVTLAIVPTNACWIVARGVESKLLVPKAALQSITDWLVRWHDGKETAAQRGPRT